MATKLTVNMTDYSGEKTSTHFWLPNILADGTNYAAVLTAAQTLANGVLAASDCDGADAFLSVRALDGPGTTPTIVTAQREIGVRVQYTDDVNGRVGSFVVPGPLTTFYPPQGVPGDYIPLSNVIFAAFILVLEANAKSQDGNAITVTEGRLIGRNN